MIATRPFRFDDLQSHSESGGRSHAGGLTGPGPAGSADAQCRAMTFSPFDREGEDTSQKARRFTEEDMTRAVEEAKTATAARVEAAVRDAMANDILQHQQDVLSTIAEQLMAKSGAFEHELAAIARTGQMLAMAMVKAVIPRAIEREPLADIADLLQTTLDRLTTSPSVTVRLAPDLAEAGRAFLTEAASKARFAGDVEILADPDLALGDAVFSWKGGIVERRLDRLQEEVFDLVDHWLADETPASSDDPPSLSQPTPDPMRKDIATAIPNEEPAEHERRERQA